MQFLHPGGTLEVDSTGLFGPTISGFAAGDVIDAGAVGFVTGTTTVGFNGGTLTVTDGAQSAAFTLVRQLRRGRVPHHRRRRAWRYRGGLRVTIPTADQTPQRFAAARRLPEHGSAFNGAWRSNQPRF